MALSPPIPIFYRVFFRWVDPIMTAPMLYMGIFKRRDMMATLNPMFSRYDTAYDPLMWQATGFNGMLAVLSVCLLRHTNDVGVWKILTGSILCVDVAMLAGIYEMLSTQGRMSLGLLSASDWTNILMALTVSAVRTAFIFDVGFGSSAAASKKLL